MLSDRARRIDVSPTQQVFIDAERATSLERLEIGIARLRAFLARHAQVGRA